MKNKLFLPIAIFLIISFGHVGADNYIEAVIGHVITQKAQNNDMDHGAVAKAEVSRQLHRLSLQSIAFIFSDMPNIFKGISAKIRSEADTAYICSIQDDYKNKECY